MKTLFALPLIFILILSFLALPAQARSSQDEFFVVDNYIEGMMQKYHIPGVALAIVEGDQVVYEHGYGSADPSGRPVTPQTPFIIGSTSKSLTAVAVMQLVDAGKIELDAPVQRYLPWFTLGDGRITVRQLLNHTSGISKSVGQETLASNYSGEDALEVQVRNALSSSLVHVPGTTFEYANINYEIAGLIVKEVSGQSFESYMHQSVFAPLDMTCSYTAKTEAQEHGLAEGYHYWFGFPFPAGNTPYPRHKIPSGYLAMCAEDMAHTLIMHLNDGLYQGMQIVSGQGIAELHRPVLDNYAMGWGVSTAGILEHSGAVPDYGSGIILDPRNKLGVVVLYNINNALGAEPISLMHVNVLNLLTGSIMAEPPSNHTYGSVLAVLLILLLAAVAWIFISRAWMNRWKTKPERRPKGPGILPALVIPPVIELGIIAAISSQITSLSYGLRNLYLHQPDLTSLFLLLAILVVVNSSIRTITGIRLCSSRGR